MPLTSGYPSPNSLTLNMDTVMTLAFANAGGEIFDAISKNNAFFYEIKKNGMYEAQDQMNPQIIVPLLYALNKLQWYKGWDVLGTQPTEGLTDALYEWCQAAVPAGYNEFERKVTQGNALKSILRVKIDQAKMSATQGWNDAFLLGNINAPGGSLLTPVADPVTGRTGIDPLPKMVYYDTTLSAIGQPAGTFVVGGLDQALYPWWRNWSLDAGGISTDRAFLNAFDLMYTRVSRGPGGAPNLIFTDDTTRSLLNTAYYEKYRRNMDSDADYPFDNLKFRGARVVTDESVPDVEGGLPNCDVKGTAYFLNTQFMKVKYHSETNFVLTDLQKPVNQDGKVGHVMWMGAVCMMNRRKHGVIGNIPRTLTAT